MIIGGFHPLSLCDFPHTPAAVLFLQGCNWRCSYCHNKELIPRIPRGTALDYTEILALLKARSRMLRGVVFTGGEPTLHGDIEQYMAEIKELGLRIKLDTNGSNPAMLERLIDSSLLDYIAMDIKAPLEKYESIICCSVSQQAIEKSIELIAGCGIEHQFRTTWPKDLLSEEDITRIREFLPKGSHYVVQQCRE